MDGALALELLLDQPVSPAPPAGNSEIMAVAIVTGGNRGIARATAVALAKAGCDVDQ